jgi:predicted dehydrogenase
MTDRREFLKRAALAGAMPMLASRVESTGPGQPRKLGVALVGLGSLSTNQIAPALQKTRHCRLAGIVTGTPAKAARWKTRYGIPDRSIYDYRTMSRMADNPDIDIVYVVTPNALHGEHTISAARAGKHVFCEKPMEISVERCEAMIAACTAAGRQLGIGYRCRFEPHHLEVARLAREKTFGDLRVIQAGFGFAIGNPNQWRLDRDLAGGGALMDVGIYALQSARMITAQEPTLISALEVKTDATKFRDVDETMTFQLTFPSGVIAHCVTSYRVPGINAVKAFADRGWFGLEPAYDYAGIRGSRSDGAPLQFEPEDPFATELDEFARCILSNEPTSVSGEEGLRDVRLLMRIYEAARTGKTMRPS